MNKLRWGLLSTANINSRLIPAIRASERGELAAVASRTQESADAYAAEWEIQHSFGSYEAMLASDTVDVVYIGLPNHLHAEWSIKAMEMGKHVLCEKPFAISLDEVDRMTQTAMATGRKLAEAFMYLHHPQTKETAAFLKKGGIGEVMVVRGVFTFKMPPGENVRLRPDMGGGSLWDVGCYPVSIAQHFLGSAPQWVFGDQFVGSAGVDMDFVGQMHYEGGKMAQFTSGFHTPFTTFVEALGREGRLTLNMPFIGHDEGNNEVIVYPAAGESYQLQTGHTMLYLGEVEDMHDAILEDAPNAVSLETSRNHVATLLALYKSAETGEAVNLRDV